MYVICSPKSSHYGQKWSISLKGIVITVILYLSIYIHLATFKAPKELDALLKEFINYKLLVQDNVPSSVWEEALVVDESNDELIIEWISFGTTYVQLRLLTVVSASIDFRKWLS